MRNQDNDIRAAPGSSQTSIRPPRCPRQDRWAETCNGIMNGREASSDQIVRSFRNGCYQHLMFLGICGFAICNHCDEEILLVDPWPTYHSRWTELIPTVDARPLTNQETDAKRRLADLATFLRNAVDMGYTLSGILLSHMHFDHADDAVLLLELLAAETGDWGSYTDHRDRQFLLDGPPVPIDRLPRICCDYDTIIYLLTHYFYVHYEDINIHGNEEFRPPGRIRPRQRYWYGNEALRERLDQQYRSGYPLLNTDTWRCVKERYSFIPGDQAVRSDSNDSWLEITLGGGQHLHYDDSYNAYLDNESARCIAGQQCQQFVLGSFRITPYVWDHMNTGAFKLYNQAIDEQSAGDLQRITAYMVQHAEVEDAKRTFIVGGSGEMNDRWTEAILDNPPTIETDLLIQAIVDNHPAIFTHFRLQTHAMQEFMTRNIIVHDALMFVHFEEFVREVADRRRYVEGFDEAVDYNLRVLRDEIGDRRDEGNTDQVEIYNGLLQRNRLYVLARRGFEADIPADPQEFEDESNEYVDIPS